MKRLFLYSPDPYECAGCSARTQVAGIVGATKLDAPHNPLVLYTLCEQCTSKWQSRRKFRRLLNDRLVARGRALGAFDTADEASAGEFR